MSYLGGSPAMVDIAGLILNQADPESGLEAGFTTIAGWHKRAPMEVDRQRRSGHGEFATTGQLAGRVITINGWAVADNRGDVARWTEDLAALLADGTFGRLTVTDDDLGERWATVQMIDDPSVEWDGQEWVRFQIALLAPDPLKYGALSSGSTSFATDPAGAGLTEGEFDAAGVMDWGAMPTSDGVVTVANDGSAAAGPVFTITGPTPPGGFVIIETSSGRRVTFLGRVPAGSVLVMNSADGSVEIDGSAGREGDTVVTRWPEVAAHGSASYYFQPLGSPTAATLTVAVTATYY